MSLDVRWENVDAVQAVEQTYDIGDLTGDGCSLLNSRRVENPPACVMQTEIVIADTADPSTADEGWAAWVARGVEHDGKTRKRAIAAAAVVAGGLGLWLAIPSSSVSPRLRSR